MNKNKNKNILFTSKWRERRKKRNKNENHRHLSKMIKEGLKVSDCHENKILKVADNYP